MSSTTTNSKTNPLRVSVDFKESSVFAGEDVQCTITFKNVASAQSAAERTPDARLLHPDRSRPRPLAARSPSVAQSVSQSVAPSVISSVKNSPRHDVAVTPQGAQSAAPPGRARGHRPTLSLNTPHLPGAQRSPSALNNAVNGSTTPVQNHGRSLSIMSIHSDAVTGTNTGSGGMPAPKRPPRGHGRSASLQVVSGRGANLGTPGAARPLQPSPFFSSSPPPLGRSQTDFNVPMRPKPSRRTSKQSTAPGTPSAGESRKQSLGNFRFPPTSPEPNSALGEMSPALEISPAEDPLSVSRTRNSSLAPSLGGLLLRSPEDTVAPRDKLQPSPVTRIISGSSMNGGSTRSSGEFYTMSNNSTETLASEYISRPTARLLPKLMQDRKPSNLASAHPRLQNKPEVLMMGYAQIMGSFTLDGSLINQAPFEEVKRKGMMGGQGGGGVVGIERTKRESGLFGALGWSNLGESLGGLLGGAEPSSIREMRSIASSKTVPLLSTPQSILFVDLKLAPGESKSYTYTFTLPRGLPPTHKGRVMKVNYHLSIGTQRPGSSAQAVRSVNVPFRVFGSVTNRGEILGHDLMSPYIILRDQATVSALPKTQLIQAGPTSKKANGEAKQALGEFEDYVRNLLDNHRRDANASLLSPTEAPKEYRTRRRSTLDEHPVNSMKEAIDFAILRSNTSFSSAASTNRFEIARNGRRVAVIKLARPAFRLGETISALVDFERADVPVFGIAVTLESSEKVDPAIALRSAASVYRVTRKVHASFAENTLFARRVSFAPTVPPNATPEFVTSGISLDWKLRVEFVTPRMGAAEAAGYSSGVNTPVSEKGGWDREREREMEKTWEGRGALLEELTSDDRGSVLAAVERLNCESFEVAVPIRIYGASTGSEGLTVEQEEGYAI